MKILSLFDGMSVAQQALKEAGIPVEAYYASEIDPYAIAVTQSNFPETIQLGDISEMKDSEDGAYLYPYPIDLLIGGSPCQDLSIAKKNREGLKGQRSGLFYEYVRIRDEVNPKYFILENVASMPKEAREQISEILGVQPVMINASLVSAQNRKRLFWVGKWNGEKYEQVEIPQPEDRGILLKDILEENVDEKYYVKNIKFYESQTTKKGDLEFIGGIKNKDWAGDGKGYSRNYPQGDRVYGKNGKSASLSALGGGRGAKTGLYCISSTQKHATVTTDKSSPMVSAMGMGGGHVPMVGYAVKEATKKGYAIAKEGDSIDLSFPNIGVVQNMQIRKLAPTECLRLQSMPDNYFDKAEYKGKPISNTQRYKMCGNAFNCEVIKHILKFLGLKITTN